jgi:hypothetical protein
MNLPQFRLANPEPWEDAHPTLVAVFNRAQIIGYGGDADTEGIIERSPLIKLNGVVMRMRLSQFVPHGLTIVLDEAIASHREWLADS